MTNPFDDIGGRFLVLVNDEGQHSLWPALLPVPVGWEVAHDADDREICLAHVESAWRDMRPASLLADSGEHLPTVPRLFEEQVAATPEATALVTAAERLSYARLNERANRLARMLISQGAGPEDVVALALPRSADLVVAVLAVIKSGAAYLPLDPAHPADRIRTILGQAKPRCVLSTRQIAATLPPVAMASRLRVIDDALPADGSNLTDADRTTPLRPAHPAYLIYTSGSTGTPKGVLGPHEGLIARVRWFGAEFAEQRIGTVCAKASMSVIDGTTELFCALLHGGTVLLADDEQVRSPLELLALLTRSRVDRITVVPSLLAVLLDQLDPEVPVRCPLWISSGEALSGAAVARFRKAVPDARLYNYYGTTEAVGDSVFAECGDTTAPMGEPIPGTAAFVLDETMRSVSPGASGELYLAGPCLARGYLNRPALTAERFVASPFEPGGRIYRTGDIVTVGEDGVLHFVGRADDQVKIRGFRVEPGEVQAVLDGHPGVLRSAVSGRPEPGGGGQRLIAHYIPSGGRVEGAVLRGYARHRLPGHMVPAAFVPVPQFPLLPSGKLDRRALPEPEPGRPSDRTARSPHEEILCTVFAEILGLPAVGVDDDFFDHGGHSLSATWLVSRIRAELDVGLSVADVFDAPTVALLAARIVE